jgi:hypothetical protein
VSGAGAALRLRRAARRPRRRLPLPLPPLPPLPAPVPTQRRAQQLASPQAPRTPRCSVCSTSLAAAVSLMERARRGARGRLRPRLRHQEHGDFAGAPREPQPPRASAGESEAELHLGLRAPRTEAGMWGRRRRRAMHAMAAGCRRTGTRQSRRLSGKEELRRRRNASSCAFAAVVDAHAREVPPRSLVDLTTSRSAPDAGGRASLAPCAAAGRRHAAAASYIRLERGASRPRHLQPAKYVLCVSAAAARAGDGARYSTIQPAQGCR